MDLFAPVVKLDKMSDFGSDGGGSSPPGCTMRGYATRTFLGTCRSGDDGVSARPF